MKTSNDSRTVEKTKRSLRKAMTAILSSSKQRERISVKELTQEADVSRATFYLHYNNIEEFYYDTISYLASLFVEQLMVFMQGGIANAKHNSRRHNMLMDDDDRALLAVLAKRYFNALVYNEELKQVYKKLIDYAIAKNGEEYVKKNYMKVRFFFNGYILTMIDELADYEPDRLCRNLIRSFALWEHIVENYD